MSKLQGLIAATFTPMTDGGELDTKLVGPLVDHLVASGITGLYVSGTTGEGESLTVDERRASGRAHVEAAAGRIPVIVQVGRNSLRDARALAKDAQRAGADAIAASSPSFFKPASVDALAACLAEIAAGAPDLPLYYYHLPRMTGVDLDIAALLDIAPQRVPSLAGVKYSTPDLAGLQNCLRADGGRFDILFGCDEMLLAGLATGARAAVGSTYNLAAPIYLAVLDAFDRGELEAAREHQARAVQMVDVLLRHGGLPAFKATMGLLGLACGPVRLPLQTLTSTEVDAMRADLEAIGFFEQVRQS